MLFFLGFNAVQAETTDPETIVDSISLEHDPYRYALQLYAPEHRLIFSQLKTGNTYTVFLNTTTPDAFQIDLPANIKVEFLGERSFRFKAQNPDLEIKLCKNDRFQQVAVDLSIGSNPSAEPALLSPPGIETDQNYSPQELIHDIFVGGDCFDVDVNSITYTGHVSARGFFFSGSSSINIEEGVMLSTGNIANSAGPNNAYNTGNSFGLNFVDPDLADMVNSNSIYDVSSIAFDFVPTTDKISFEFVFASEEYCEYVNSTYNDVFGFFVSGPGINGPFSNNAANIALIPNTTDYIAINSVNHLLNSTYYLNNIPAAQHSQIPSTLQCSNHPMNNGVAIQDIEFDGFTTVMTVLTEVIPCETYHIKLAIADVGDHYFDSAVFLKASSFNAGETAVVSTLVPGGSSSSNVAYEGCDEAYFVFQRPGGDLSQPLTVNFSYSPTSTAIPDVDFEMLPDSIVIPAGDSIFYLAVNIYDDLIAEGIETLILELDAPCSCTNPFVEMQINDVEPLTLELEDLSFCGPVAIALSPVVNGGIGDYIFNWNTSDTLGSIEINPETSTNYSLTVTDACGNTVAGNAIVEIIEIPAATISGYHLVCPENPTADILITLQGSGPWELTYNINGVPQTSITGISASPYVLTAQDIGVYHLTGVSHNGCTGTVQGAATLAPTNIQIAAQPVEESCPDAGDGSIDITVSGGSSPYQYLWDNGAGTGEDPSNLTQGVYNLTLTDANGCTSFEAVTVPLNDEVPVAEAGEDATLNCLVSELTLSGSGSQGSNYQYLWTTAGGNILSGETTLSPEIDQAGIYFLNIINLNTNCTTVDEVEVFTDTLAPVPVIEVEGPLSLDCANPLTTLNAGGSAPQGMLEFEWTTEDGNIPTGNENIPNPEVNAAGTYHLTITNTVNGCSAASLYEIDADFEPPVADIANPLILTCADTLIQLDAGNSSAGSQFEYLWQTADGNIVNGNQTLFPWIDQPGIYTLTIQNLDNHCETIAITEVEQDIEAPNADAGEPVELDCNTFQATLDGSQSSSGPFYSYSWATQDGNIVAGQSGLFPVVDIAAVYALTVLNQQNGCTASDEALVTEDLNVPTAVDVLVTPPECFGDPGSISVVEVFGGDSPYLYSIDGGESFFSFPDFYYMPSGDYNLVIQDSEGCLYEDAVFIPYVHEIGVSVIPEVTIELGADHKIQAIVNIPLGQLSSVSWSPSATLSCGDCIDPVARPFETTLYTITVSDQNGCEATAQILVRVDRVRKVYIPNAFSPNADGINDVFLVYTDEKSVLKINRLEIFDRWGGKVFENFDFLPNDRRSGWDGMVGGKRMNPGVFVYLVEIEFVDGEKILYKGDLTLLE